MRACHCAFGREKIAESFEKNPNIWDELLNSFAGYFVLPILLKLSMMMCVWDWGAEKLATRISSIIIGTNSREHFLPFSFQLLHLYLCVIPVILVLKNTSIKKLENSV